VVTRHEEEHSGPKLDEATVVVSGGRGLGSPGNYALITELAQLLNGARAHRAPSSTPVGQPYAFQVGQTGKTVKTGGLHRLRDLRSDTARGGHEGRAVHHRRSTRTGKLPSSAIADLGVVGDVDQGIPRLIEAIRARR